VSATQPAFSRSGEHLPLGGETCPVCDQPIPNERADEVRARMELRDRQLAETAVARASRHFAAEKAQIEAAAKEALETLRKENAEALAKLAGETEAQIAAARAEASRTAEIAAQGRITALESTLRERETDWEERFAAAAGDKQAAVERYAALKADHDDIVNSRVQEAREALEKDKADALNAAKAAHADETQRLTGKLEDATRQLERNAVETAAQVAAARAEASRAAEAGAHGRVAALESTLREREADWQEKIAAAATDKQAAVERYAVLKAEHDDIVNSRVQEAREALEKDKADALNAAKAAYAAETQKLTGKLEDMTRQLDKKTAEELGEGAEVKLFDALRAEFDDDRIERVGKGNAGADIRHTVIHNGRECGTIIYDSKNSTAWRNDYVSKLVQDQTAAKADHAILCVLKFPAETKQLAIREGVIIVNPARAIALVHIVRKHMIQVHPLRLSKTERAKKMASLYDFITSERCRHLLGRIDSHADALLEMQEKEIKAHESNWKKQGTHLRSIQKVKAELEAEIDRIIDTDDGTGMAPWPRQN